MDVLLSTFYVGVPDGLWIERRFAAVRREAVRVIERQPACGARHPASRPSSNLRGGIAMATEKQRAAARKAREGACELAVARAKGR